MKKDVREYFSNNIIFDNKDHFCIWFSEGKSGFITEENKIKSFPTYNELSRFAEKNGIRLNDERESLTVDYAIEQLKNKTLDCNYLISIWHAAEDIADSLEIPFYGSMGANNTDDIYDRLFWGCNLPAVTPKGKHYTPIWTGEELRILTRTIKDGIRIIKFFVG
jgi:hypothetical protein